MAARYAIETFSDDLESDFEDLLGSPTSLSTDDSLGISGLLGYRCHRHFSLEAEVEWLDGFDADVSVAPLGKVAKIEIEPLVVTTNVKGYILTGRVQPFLLAGFGVMVADAKLRVSGVGSDSNDETDFATRFGGGIDFYATKHVVVGADASYVLPFGDLEDLDYVSIGIGLEYRF